MARFLVISSTDQSIYNQLVDMGYSYEDEVEIVFEVSEAVGLIQLEDFDCVFSRVSEKDFDGLAFAEKMLKEGSASKFILGQKTNEEKKNVTSSDLVKNNALVQIIDLPAKKENLKKLIGTTV